MSHGEPVPSKRAIFLSYASEDAAAVQRIAEALRSAGIEAWLDQDELGGGDTWDMKIRSQIRSCRLFMPVISAATQARAEGYFRREWKLAVERTLDMADHLPFLVPVAIDGTSELEARVPDKFREVHWTWLPGGDTSATFCARLNQLLAGAEPAPVPSGRGSAGPGPPAPRMPPMTPAREPAGDAPPGARPDREAAPPVPDYELLRRIGSGSYGEVWLARGVTGIYRAVKVVYRDHFEDADPFEREFRGLRDFAAISLQAKGQMALLHIGRNDPLGFFYYVMELADDANTGRALDPATYVPLTLKEWRQRLGRVPASAVVTAGVELASALAALHASGLVHRDIKPSNAILVNGQAKLADIGLVAGVSEAHTFIGTAGYVPPEGPGSPAADVFALGCVLYELATGLDREEFPRLPPDFGQWPDKGRLVALNEVILRACEADLRRRYLTATALRDDLLALQAGGARRRRRPRSLAIAAAVLAGLALGLGAWWKSHSGAPAAAASLSAGSAPAAAPAAAEKSIAVLAFVNLSEDKDNEYFSDGISEELLNALAAVPGLKVMARTSSFFFKDKNVPVTEIARQLHVAFVVEGSVRKSGSKVRITAELIKAADGFRVWSKSFDRELNDILALQDELSSLIVGQLRVPLGLTGSVPAADRSAAQTPNLAAHELYWRGRFEFNKKSPDGLTRCIDLYEQAVGLDPDFGLAWAQLATARSWAIYLYGADRATYLPAMQLEAARAEELAPDLADTQVALSELFMENWEWKAARQASDRAVALAPSDSEVLQMASFVALAAGDNKAVERFASQAIERDPFNVGGFLNLGFARIAAGDFVAAEKIARQTIALAPNMDWGYFDLMEVCLRQNRPDEAEACVKNLNGDRQMIAPALVAQARGNRATADAELKHLLAATEIPQKNPYLIAEVYGFRGDADRAFLWLDRAYAVHSQLFCLLLTDNLLQSLHPDPRWQLLLGNLGLTAERLK